MQDSNKDITVENVGVSDNGSLISKENYDLEVQTPVEEIINQNTLADDGHPDGGLRAWLIVAGVRLLFPIVNSQFYNTFPPSLSQAMCNTCST